MKIVINRRHGGFGLSNEAVEEYARLKGLTLDPETFECYNILRNDPELILVVESLGEKANSRLSELKVVEIPDDVLWHIGEYDGMEWVSENHRTWS